MIGNSSSENENKKTYQKYTRDMRLRLIQMVQEEKMSTAEAGRLIGIKQTSACRIINSYKKHQRIFERKADRLLRQQLLPSSQPQKTEEPSFRAEQNCQNTDRPAFLPPVQTHPCKKEQNHQSSILAFPGLAGMGLPCPQPFGFGYNPQFPGGVYPFGGSWMLPYPLFY